MFSHVPQDALDGTQYASGGWLGPALACGVRMCSDPNPESQSGVSYPNPGRKSGARRLTGPRSVGPALACGVRIVAVTLLLAFSMGGSCSISISQGADDDNNGSGSSGTPLDQTTLTLSISRTVGDEEADVAATIKDSRSRSVTLTSGQAVEVNGATLDGPTGGVYDSEVAAASEYAVVVREPTIGVQTTTIASPADFEVTSHAENAGASLSGFTLEWSGADESQQVSIKLSQTAQGSTRSETFGPLTDDGSHTLAATDLSDFVHGTNVTLTIEITKTRSTTSINGVKAGTLSTELTATRTVVPRP